MTTLPLILCFGALIASLNPCTLSVMIMAIGSLLGNKKHPRHAARYIAMFAAGVFVAYTLLGLTMSYAARLLPVAAVGYVALLAALVLVVFGVFEIKDYFWYGKGWSFKLSARAENTIHAWTKTHHSHWRGFLLGIYTSLKLSHYTLVMVVAFSVLSVLTSSHFTALPIVWAFWYSLPLCIVALLVAAGVNVHSLMSWKEESKHTMRLSIGLLYVVLGWVLLVYLAGGLHLA